MTNIDMIQPDLPNVVIGPVISEKKTTMADAIRSMSDEEIAEFMYDKTDDATYEDWLKWLKQEA